MSGPNMKMFKKLAAARRRFPQDLLYLIVSEYFRANKDNIIKELEEYDAGLQKARQDTRGLRKAQELQREEAMKDPRRIALQQFRVWAFREIGKNAPSILDNYLRRRHGTPIISDLPMSVIEEVLGRLGGETEPAAVLKALENLDLPVHIAKLI
jgi:hypothetical protein